MKNKIFIWTIILTAGLSSGLFGISCRKDKSSAPAQSASLQQSSKYWTCAMHPEVRSDKPGKCPLCGMDLILVEKKEQIIYYRSPMDPSLTSPTPMKDSMGMDYIPVYEEEGREKEAQGAGSLSLNQRQMELSGMATVLVKKADIFKEIRTVGKIAYDPELTIAQEEFLIALETLDKVGSSPDQDVVTRARDLVDKSKFRLKVLGMSDEQIEELRASKESQRNLILPDGKAWVYADVYEYELSWIKEGLPVKVTTLAYPGEEFNGIIKAINPILDPNTRSARVRLEVDNPDKKLKPEMFVDVFIQASLGEGTLVVRREAILDTGTRKIVWVDKGRGNFEAREIKTGPEGVTLEGPQKVKVFPVLSGLSEGEYVVTKGNFLLDSQSQLTGGMSVLWGGATEIKEEAGAGQEK